MEEVESVPAEIDAVSMSQPIGIMDTGLVDQNAVGTSQIAEIKAVRPGDDFSMFT